MLLFIARGQKSGAGQEAARWFLSVGAASGTVAETICVYVKDVSDQIYGAPERATCRRTGLSPCSTGSISSCNRLSPARAKATRFFVFADTVAARDCSGASQHHGWLGIRFQAERATATAGYRHPGVNLIYAACYFRSNREAFLPHLKEAIICVYLWSPVARTEAVAFSRQRGRDTFVR